PEASGRGNRSRKRRSGSDVERPERLDRYRETVDGASEDMFRQWAPKPVTGADESNREWCHRLCPASILSKRSIRSCLARTSGPAKGGASVSARDFQTSIRSFEQREAASRYARAASRYRPARSASSPSRAS